MFSWSSSLQATFSFLAVLPVIRQVSRYISSVCLVAFPGVVFPGGVSCIVRGVVLNDCCSKP